MAEAIYTITQSQLMLASEILHSMPKRDADRVLSVLAQAKPVTPAPEQGGTVTAPDAAESKKG